LAAREAELRGLGRELADFEDERGAVRDALWYCDAVTGPDGQRLDPEERWAEVERRYGRDHVVSRFVREARPELMGAVKRTRERLRAAGFS